MVNIVFTIIQLVTFAHQLASNFLLRFFNILSLALSVANS